MKFKRHMELEHGLKQIDIAPLIDMVFLLLIFFMLTSTFVTQTVIKVGLPKALTSDAVKYANMEITVSKENALYLNGREVTAQELRSSLKPIVKRDLPILIKSDEKASLGKVVEIWDLCRDLGITRINIATNKQPAAQ
ncbi:MAG: biopolymer transporter ExbD [Candidatus Omnitrophica bacterium]|nr:biopolymer transporter ExbD [Candidatus Omnitrophota bacterium]